MLTKRLIRQTIIFSVGVILFSGCGVHQNGGKPHPLKEHTDQFQSLHQPSDRRDVGDVGYHYTDRVPEQLAVADEPAFPIGSKAIIKSDELPGMQYAVATIKGAYDTTAYEIQYTLADGSDQMTYKWVLAEEFLEFRDEPFKNGELVQVDPDALPDLNGANVQIVDHQETTVYMVDFISTSKEEIENFKWVSEEDLQPLTQKRVD
ncbi:DUF1541 domain-containing protein [Shouchella sp. JSM 1781072]|uniref:DUF1541 domain-containing protein n=1 Tax=Bacillaceae TaxID=186817 RepID=UPI000C08AA81|nr:MULTISPECIES: DUF1541 domain-containing protein [Bacillaceae]UTR06173.1 DUF1541 domain-containing protein [Alkalihalobacillus sp. LMS6]